MERCCHTYTIEICKKKFIDRYWINPLFVNIYMSECYKIISNLNTVSINGCNSNYFIDKIISGEINTKDVCGLSSFDMCPEASRAERNSIEVRSQQKIKQKVSEHIECPKCREKACYYFEIHTKGLDEPSDLHYVCTACDAEGKLK